MAPGFAFVPIGVGAARRPDSHHHSHRAVRSL